MKPPVTVGVHQHYLLFTPFRYPPLRHGSRFGSRHEQGIWYGAESQRTAFAEVAYYRLLFFEGTHARLDLVTTALTAFTVRMRSADGIDLTAPLFAAHREATASPLSYAARADGESGDRPLRQGGRPNGEHRDRGPARVHGTGSWCTSRTRAT